MRKIIVSEGVSLDGVFDAQTMGQWAAPFYSNERDQFIRGIVLASDALLLGRTTYDLQAWYWPSQKEDKFGARSTLLMGGSPLGLAVGDILVAFVPATSVIAFSALACILVGLGGLITSIPRHVSSNCRWWLLSLR